MSRSKLSAVSMDFSGSKIRAVFFFLNKALIVSSKAGKKSGLIDF